MTKYQNPFQTIAEALTTLKSLGADPLRNLPAGQHDWRADILNINVNRSHDLSENYCKCSIHLTSEGFGAVMQLLEGEYPIKQEMCFADYDVFSIEVSPLLELYKLEIRKSEEGAQ